MRRAERRVVELFDKKETTNPALQQYLNRLSSLLFVLELMENRAAGEETTKARAATSQSGRATMQEALGVPYDRNRI